MSEHLDLVLRLVGPTENVSVASVERGHYVLRAKGIEVQSHGFENACRLLASELQERRQSVKKGSRE